MKTSKKSIIAAMLMLACFTIAQAQEVSRKGWDGTVKGKQTQGATFGEKTSSVSTDENQTNSELSKKGYDYYQSKSELDSSSKLSNNKHPDLMKRSLNTSPGAVQEENELDNKTKPTSTTSKKEYVGHVTLMK